MVMMSLLLYLFPDSSAMSTGEVSIVAVAAAAAVQGAGGVVRGTVRTYACKGRRRLTCMLAYTACLSIYEYLKAPISLRVYNSIHRHLRWLRVHIWAAASTYLVTGMCVRTKNANARSRNF